MKKAISLILTIALLFSLMPAGTFAQTAQAATAASGTCGSFLTWELTTDGRLTISGSGQMKNYTSSDTAPWYNNRTSIKSVVINKGVTSIGDYAFSNCPYISSVIISDTVASIGSYAFQVCSSVTSLEIPSSVSSIGESAFRYCTALPFIYIPASVTNISKNSFEDCSALTKITVAESNPNYSSDQYGVLFNKDKTTLVACPGAYSGAYVIPDTVVNIGEGAFENCSKLTGVVFGKSVNSIGRSAFSKCNGLTSIQIGESVTNIGDYAFHYCYGAVELKIPDSVTSIGEYAFDNCSGLTSVKIPASVTNMGKLAFSGCRSLKNVEINANIGASAFNNCDGLTNVTIGESVTHIGENAFIYCDNLASVAIGKSVTHIGEDAFAYCPRLNNIEIPDSVVSIGNHAFGSCTGLNEITFLGDAPSFRSNTFYKTTATAYYPANNATWFADDLQNYGGTITWTPYGDALDIIAEGSCGPNAKWRLGSDGLLVIYGTGGMYGYSSSANVPWNSYSSSIRRAVFRNGITSICNSAFYNHTQLTEVTIADSVVNIGSYAFYNCEALTSVTIPPSVTKINESTFSGCKNLKSVSIPESVTSIDGCAFEDCTSLPMVKISHAITNIATSAFTGCVSLEKFVVDQDNPVYSSDDDGVLFNKDKTTLHSYPGGRYGSYEVPDSVTYIGYSSFSKCVNLTSLKIPASVLTIDAFAFANCVGLTNVEFSNSACGIALYAFSNCTGLTKLTFGGPAPRLRSTTFNGVTATAYYYPDETWTADVLQNYGGTITWVALIKCEHDYTEWMPIGLDGVSYKIRACQKCGYIETDLPENGEHLHDWQLENYQSPTCTEPGYKDYIWCKTCDLTVSKISVDSLGHDDSGFWQQDAIVHWKICQRENCGEKILEAGHSYGSWIEDFSAGCETVGSKHRICTICGHTQQGEILELGHDDSGSWQQDATGHWKICQRENCGEKILEAGHSYGSWIEDFSAGCETVGSKHRTCTICGHIQQGEIPELGHSFANGVCGVCGEEDPDFIKGVTLSGSYKSFGKAADSFTVLLIPVGAEEAAYTFTNENAAANSGSWSVEGVQPGSYTVRVTKKNHVTREYTLTVSDSAVALDVEIWLLGDVGGDGRVNFSDFARLLKHAKDPAGSDLAGYTWLCGDVNGDGKVTFIDYGMVLAQAKGNATLW